MKRIYALMTSAVLLVSFSSGLLPQEYAPPVTAMERIRPAEAAGTVTFDESTGVLILSGQVANADVQRYKSDASVKKVVAAEGTVLPRSCVDMFNKFLAQSIDLSKADSSQVVFTDGMFANCTKLTELNLEGFDTSHVTSMQGMFCRARAMKELDVSSWDTSNVTDMGSLFADMDQLEKLNIEGLNTSKVTDMEGMFGGEPKLKELDVSKLDTSQVTAMDFMFSGNKQLTTLDVSNFDTSKVTTMLGMFNDCESLTEIDITTFDTTQLQEAAKMFSECDKLKTIRLKDFNTSKVKRFEEMFAYDPELVTIYSNKDLDISSLDTSDSYSIFKDSKKLTGGSGTIYGSLPFSSHDYDLLCIDTFEKPGMLTDSAAPETPDTSDVVFDEKTGTLTLSGKLNKTHVRAYGYNDAVKKVVAKEGTVFPPDSSNMFEGMKAESFDLSKADTSFVKTAYEMIRRVQLIK